jgi:hypothetical protein
MTSKYGCHGCIFTGENSSVVLSHHFSIYSILLRNPESLAISSIENLEKGAKQLKLSYNYVADFKKFVLLPLAPQFHLVHHYNPMGDS